MVQLAYSNVAHTKLRDVAAWARRKLGSTAHEERVARIAATLFDLTKPWHRLGAAERSLLLLGAFVHDVGRAVAKDEHETIGAYLITTEGRVLLGEAERRRVAFLTRYHRGPVPKKGEEEFLREGDDRKALWRVLAFLRAADGLDSRWMPSPRLVFAVHERNIEVLCYYDGPRDEARWPHLKHKKFRLLEEELECRVSPEMRWSTRFSLVA